MMQKYLPYLHMRGVFSIAKWEAAVMQAHASVHKWAISNRRLSTSPTGRARFVVELDRIQTKETK